MAKNILRPVQQNIEKHVKNKFELKSKTEGICMIHTKHISLNDECLKKMEPYIKKHQGNFSSAMREIIDNVGRASSENSIFLDEPLFNWILSDIDGKLISDDVLDAIIDPSLINRIGELDRFINQRLDELNWGVTVNISCDNVLSPYKISVRIVGAYQRIRFVACMISQFIIKHSSSSVPFLIKSVINLDDEIKIEFVKTSDKKQGFDSLITFFGSLENVRKAINSRPEFWKHIIDRHILSDYNMVTIHRNYYEDILTGNTPMGEIMIETLAKKPIQDISLKEILPIIKQVYEISRVADRIDIRDADIMLHHSYRDRIAIERIKKQLIVLMKANGHLYDAKTTANMIVFEHNPDVRIKINQMINNLKESNSRLDQELIIFLASLKELKDMADTQMSISIIGRKMGIALMQEYEKENAITKWSLANFQKAFETIDSKIYRDSEFKLDNNRLLYRIRKCGIVRERDVFDACVCKIVREVFKGALNYAFGNKAELSVNRLITHGDDCCEVAIRIL